MDPLSIIALIGAAVAGITGIVQGVKQTRKEEETTQYNKELNQKIMDREDNSWQRAVSDRSAAGLSIAGLTQGSGAGGTVSQLQAPQGNGQLANLLQNMSATGFGLASSAYDRKLQKEIHTDELQLKKQQLKHDKLVAQWNNIKDLANLKLAAKKAGIDSEIYEHNIKIAKDNGTVYGSNPDTIERLVNALSQSLTGKNAIENATDTVKSVTTGAKTNLENFTDSLTGNSQQQNMDKLKNNVRKELYNLIQAGNNVQEVTQENGKYYIYTKNKYNAWAKTEKIEINKNEFDILYEWFNKQRKK